MPNFQYFGTGISQFVRYCRRTFIVLQPEFNARFRSSLVYMNNLLMTINVQDFVRIPKAEF